MDSKFYFVTLLSAEDDTTLIKYGTFYGNSENEDMHNEKALKNGMIDLNAYRQEMARGLN